MVGIKPNGMPDCVKISFDDDVFCDPGEVMEGVKKNGKPLCRLVFGPNRKCLTGQFKELKSFRVP
jgi:hypothetical protein